MRFTEEHQQLRRTVRDFVEKEINPHVDQWEREGAFPAHEVFKKAGFTDDELEQMKQMRANGGGGGGFGGGGAGGRGGGGFGGGRPGGGPGGPPQ